MRAAIPIHSSSVLASREGTHGAPRLPDPPAHKGYLHSNLQIYIGISHQEYLPSTFSPSEWQNYRLLFLEWRGQDPCGWAACRRGKGKRQWRQGEWALGAKEGSQNIREERREAGLKSGVLAWGQANTMGAGNPAGERICHYKRRGIFCWTCGLNFSFALNITLCNKSKPWRH